MRGGPEMGTEGVGGYGEPRMGVRGLGWVYGILEMIWMA